MAERIGNLVGRLQFTDDQLQKTQKGLKDAGIPMPNFGDIGRELAKEINEEVEQEVETEDEREFIMSRCEPVLTHMQVETACFLKWKTRSSNFKPYVEDISSATHWQLIRPGFV